MPLALRALVARARTPGASSLARSGTGHHISARGDIGMAGLHYSGTGHEHPDTRTQWTVLMEGSWHCMRNGLLSQSIHTAAPAAPAPPCCAHPRPVQKPQEEHPLSSQRPPADHPANGACTQARLSFDASCAIEPTLPTKP